MPDMLRPSTIWRLMTIQSVLLRYGLDEIVTATHLFRPLRYFSPGWWRRDSHVESLGARVRMALIELGPIFVKFGQSLSTRPDLLPKDVAMELAQLQDRVPPFPSEEALAIIEGAYNKPVGEVFASFDPEPLAAASIAQVHTASLKDGREVIVKVLRPGVKKRIQQDMDVLYAMAGLAERYWSEGKRLHPLEVIAEYEKTTLDELDLLREAANAAQLRRNFEGSTRLYVPEVHWDYCRKNVLVMERIYGVPIADMDTLKAKGTNFKRLADHGVYLFFTQVFRHNFFHADMHPGNIFVDVTSPANPRYIAVDFGIVGTLNTRDQYYLAENFLAFFNRDYYRVAKLHLDSGWVPPETRLDELESAFRTVCEPIFAKPLAEISFGQLLVRLFQTARRFNMEVQPQLILLQKTLLHIEGLGRHLYPQLDLWETGKPILEEWMRDRMSGANVLARLRQQLPDLNETLKDVPQLVQTLVQQATEGRLKFTVRDPEISALRKEIARSARARYSGLAAGAVLIAGALLIGLDVKPEWLGWVVAGTGAALLLFNRPRAS
jgi:ubiquinone biosynthesis protein